MALGAEPFEILADFPGWTTAFELMARQEQSRSAAGITYVKELGPPLWTLKAQSKVLPPNVLDHWRARLKVLEGGLYTFRAYPLSRVYPIAYPRGSWPTGAGFDGVSASLAAVNANRKAIAIGDLPAGFTFGVGDYLAIGTDLHQVLEAAVADGAGLTAQFEVRPHIWPGVVAGGDAVAVYRPACVMALVPGSISTDASLSGWGTVSFQGIEIR
ncbi:hypothetical protein IVA87_33860 [Bradyrhizobium sp. 147]|uniref:hypothetical protein n=1 Tax=Bradyrhizobium sp. 147 TaxID=2782623 RepID=UPI001FFB8977|nr:hypothetical protein [Bradyrhizobium sp. 147]MCK1684240.1 hypothetical protein [Bradyrhizobium sp. 147]